MPCVGLDVDDAPQQDINTDEYDRDGASLKSLLARRIRDPARTCRGRVRGDIGERYNRVDCSRTLKPERQLHNPGMTQAPKPHKTLTDNCSYSHQTPDNLTSGRDPPSLRSKPRSRSGASGAGDPPLLADRHRPRTSPTASSNQQEHADQDSDTVRPHPHRCDPIHRPRLRL